jgi:hypothetical protein
MPKFEITSGFTREEYGRASFTIEADSLEDARNKFINGDYDIGDSWDEKTIDSDNFEFVADDFKVQATGDE